MRALFSLILALATLLPLTADAYDVLVLLSRRDSAIDEVLRGFRSGRNFTQRVVVISDYADVDAMRIVREDRPRLILTLGDAALEAARKAPHTPVVALMSLSIHRLHGSSNLTGIGMYTNPENYCALFRAIRAKRVGVLFNPAKSGWYLRQATQAARNHGIELVPREVTDPRQTPAKLASLAGRIDALWMLPDTTAVTRETSEAYLRFSQEQGIPLVSFASPYLGLGAAAVIEIDRIALGRQAGEMAEALLRGAATGDFPLRSPPKVSVRTSRSVLKRLGIPSEPLEKLNLIQRD